MATSLRSQIICSPLLYSKVEFVSTQHFANSPRKLAFAEAILRRPLLLAPAVLSFDGIGLSTLGLTRFEGPDAIAFPRVTAAQIRLPRDQEISLKDMFPALERLSLRFAVGDKEREAPLSSATVHAPPSLTSLDVVTHRSIHPGHILPFVLIPTLTSLSYEETFHPSDNITRRFTYEHELFATFLLQHIGPQLLFLSCPIEQVGRVSSLAELCPRLETLHLRNATFDSRAVVFLSTLNTGHPTISSIHVGRIPSAPRSSTSPSPSGVSPAAPSPYDGLVELNTGPSIAVGRLLGGLRMEHWPALKEVVALQLDRDQRAQWEGTILFTSVHGAFTIPKIAREKGIKVWDGSGRRLDRDERERGVEDEHANAADA